MEWLKDGNEVAKKWSISSENKMTAYFFDTTALLEQVRRNPTYEPFIGATIITTKLNLFEVYYWLQKDHGIDIAKRFLQSYYPFSKNIHLTTIQKAAEIKQSHPKLSNTNCIGYAFAIQLKIPFLTSDKTCRSLTNVEYIAL